MIPRMIIAAAILAAFFVVELTTSLLINSIALLADAGHMLTDVVAVFMGLAAVMLARRGSSSPARTYGWHRAEVFTAVANAALLIGVALFILYEAVERLKEAPSIPGVPMIVVALAGLAANFVVALLLRSHSSEQPGRQGRLHGGGRRHRRQPGRADRRRGHRHDALALRRRGGRRVGRALGAATGDLPGPRALRILSESSPTHIDVEELRSALGAVDGVTEVHDLHVWTLSPGKDMCTAHLTSAGDSARVLQDARAVLSARGLDHATVQIECPGGDGDCSESF